MPDPAMPQPNVDLHAPGTGTYQVGTAPKTLQQKAQESAMTQRARMMNSSAQKVKTYAPGSDPSIKGRTSFSDEQGD